MNCTGLKTMIDDIQESTQGVCQRTKSTSIPRIEVVNEIQIVLKDNQRGTKPTTPSDCKDIKKCISSRSSKTDLTTATTPTTTTTTCETTTTKSVTIKSGRRSTRDKDKGGSSSTICVCGRLLKRVKGFLEKKEKAGGGESTNLY